MDIATKIVSTKIHTAVATVDILKGVAIAAVKNQLGLADDAIVSADASVDADGSIKVEVVEAVSDEADKPKDPAPVDADQASAPNPATDQPVALPAGLVIPGAPTA